MDGELVEWAPHGLAWALEVGTHGWPANALALVGLEFERPALLLALLLPLALILLALRPTRPGERATGALSIWLELDEVLWIDFEAGHGAGEARAALYPKAARVLGFGLWRTGHPDYQPTPISE